MGEYAGPELAGGGKYEDDAGPRSWRDESGSIIDEMDMPLLGRCVPDREGRSRPMPKVPDCGGAECGVGGRCVPAPWLVE